MLEANESASKLQYGGNAHVRTQRRETVGLGGERVGPFRGALLQEAASQR